METKQCIRCNLAKPKTSFKYKGGKTCRSCEWQQYFTTHKEEIRQKRSAPDKMERARVQSKKWRLANLERSKENGKKSHTRIVERNYRFLWEYFTKHPCEVCGEGDRLVLEFDHRDPLEKTRDISALLQRDVSLSTLTREIEKCRVLCANCHRRWTHTQYNSWRFKLLSSL